MEDKKKGWFTYVLLSFSYKGFKNLFLPVQIQLGRILGGQTGKERKTSASKDQ
jgi:hypothetical protein